MVTASRKHNANRNFLSNLIVLGFCRFNMTALSIQVVSLIGTWDLVSCHSWNPDFLIDSAFNPLDKKQPAARDFLMSQRPANIQYNPGCMNEEAIVDPFSRDLLYQCSALASVLRLGLA
jgi:hypothetical protein